MLRLPKHTPAQQVGDNAAELCSAIFAKFSNVIPVPQQRDLGIDFICEVKQEGYPTGKFFNLQCKGTGEVQTEGNRIQVSIRVETINYWLLQENPTFLIVVDCKNFAFYWSFPETFLDSLNKDWSTQDTVSIPVPKSNYFDLNVTELPFEFISKVYSPISSELRRNKNFELLSPQYEDSLSREEMTLKELMRYYLEGSRIANVMSVHAAPGFPVTVYPETFGGEGYYRNQSEGLG